MNEHKGVFNQQVREFFFGDLDSCFKVSKIKQGLPVDRYPFSGGLNFTAALVIFCVIDMMAAYYKGITTDRRGRVIGASDDNVADFLIKYFGKYDSFFSDKEKSKLFYRVFRHGLVHQWSPKASGVAMNFSSNALLVKTTYGTEEIIILNAATFYELTRKALKDYEEDLDNGHFVDQFKKRHELIVKTDYDEMRLLRSKI
jgi:hypothetical protein